MVLRMLDLPEALQRHFVEQLADATTAGRLAQANQDCKELLRRRLEALKEERRLAAEQAAQARRQRKNNAILSCFEPLEEGSVVYRCIIHHTFTSSTPCSRTLRVPQERRKLPILLNHIMHAHPAEYGIITALLG